MMIRLTGMMAAAAILLTAGSAMYVMADEAEQPVSMTLNECRERVLMHNLEISAGKSGWLAAQRSFRAEQGAVYEPSLVMGAERAHTERENTAEMFIAQGVDDFEESTRVYNMQIEQPLPTGGRLGFGYTLRDIDNNLREQREMEGADREFDGFLGLTFTQPLLKNGGFSAVYARVWLAREDSEAAFHEWRRQLMRTMAGAEAAYWDLYIAQQRVAFRTDSVRVAEQILEDFQERAAAGRATDLDVRQAEAGWAVRDAQYLEARRQRRAASNRLRTFFSETIAVSDALIMAEDLPELQQAEIDLENALLKTLSLHPEYLILIHRLEQDNVRLAFARNQRWPQLDLQATYGLNGLGETSGEAWDRIQDGSHAAWSVGLQLRVPLALGVRERNEYDAAWLRTRQGLMTLENTAIALSNQMASDLQSVMSHYQQAQRYRQMRDMHQSLLQTELERMKEGRSDSRKVLDAEEALTEAREAHAMSLTRHRVAWIELDLSMGTLLLNRNAEPMAADEYAALRPPQRRLP